MVKGMSLKIQGNEIMITRRNISLYGLFLFRIAYYATASTSDSVLIIGGYDNYYGSPSYTSTIAEYKDGNWKNVGNLAQARHGHGAIKSGSITMVVGGYPNGEES